MRMSLSVILMIALTVLLPNAAQADPCQELAAAFAKDPAAMSDAELARLRTCVTEVLRQRLSGPGTAVPAPAPRPSMAPPRPSAVPMPEPAQPAR